MIKNNTLCGRCLGHSLECMCGSTHPVASAWATHFFHCFQEREGYTSAWSSSPLCGGACCHTCSHDSKFAGPFVVHCTVWIHTVCVIYFSCVCLPRWYMGSVIIGATSVEQAKENIDACLTKLDEETFKAMDDLFIKHGNITFTD